MPQTGIESIVTMSTLEDRCGSDLELEIYQIGKIKHGETTVL